MDPVYPVYADSNVVAGRSGPADESGRYPGFVYLPCTAENDFQPALPSRHVDLIYLCYPNNPTGAVATRDALRRLDRLRRARGRGDPLRRGVRGLRGGRGRRPRSIYEIEGAREVAIESRSFSKNGRLHRHAPSLHRRAQGGARVGPPTARSEPQRALDAPRGIKSNGPPYLIQKAAAAVYTPEGETQVRALIDDYMTSARIIADGLAAAGLERLRRAQRAVHLVPHAGRAAVLGVLRPTASSRRTSWAHRRRLRPQRRGIRPPHGLGSRRADPRGRRAHPRTPVGIHPGRRRQRKASPQRVERRAETARRPPRRRGPPWTALGGRRSAQEG